MPKLTIGMFNLAAAGLSLVLAVTSCNNRLDINPLQDISNDRALRTYTDLNDALISAYNAVANEHCLGGSFRAWPDVLADQVEWNNSSNVVPGERALYQRNFSPNDSLISRNWEWAYKAINRANHVIATVDGQGVSGEDYGSNKNRLKGEALAIRALMAFELLRFYAPQYDASTAGQPAIPYPTAPTLERNGRARLTVEQAYQQVIADLTLAATLLPDRYQVTSANADVYGRFTAPAVRALLAKVYYQRNTQDDKQQALNLITQVVGPVWSGARLNGNTASRTTYPLNYALFRGSNLQALFNSTGSSAPTVILPIPGTPNNDFQSEYILQISNVGVYSSSLNYRRRFTYRPPVIGGAEEFTNPQYIPATDFFNKSPDTAAYQSANGQLFRLGQNDARNIGFFNAHILPPAISDNPMFNGRSVRPINKFFLRSADVLGSNIPLIRSAELLLIRAELNAEAGNWEQAMHDLIFVKARAGISNSSQRWDFPASLYVQATNAANGQTDIANRLIKEIRLERLRELAFEGDRLHSFRRLRLDVPVAASRGAVPAIRWDQPVLPIPASETNTNTSF